MPSLVDERLTSRSCITALGPVVGLQSHSSNSRSHLEVSKSFHKSHSCILIFASGMCAFGIIIGAYNQGPSLSIQNFLHSRISPGDTIPHVFRSIFPKLYTVPVLWLFTNRQFIIALCTICISYPLSLYRDIHKLSRASGLALIGMLIIVTSVLIEGPHVTPELKGDPTKRFTIIGPGVFQAIGVISFAFVCHHNSLLIYGSLRTPTLDRFSKVTHISTAISLIACCTLAISAYIVFTDRTQGNILNNFSPVRGLHLLMTVPLIIVDP